MDTNHDGRITFDEFILVSLDEEPGEEGSADRDLRGKGLPDTMDFEEVSGNGSIDNDGPCCAREGSLTLKVFLHLAVSGVIGCPDCGE